ncbi:putative monovalent cation/H+ antiporter subunit C [Gleimia coleocanis DSM 15436]|uniref:Putative monovalent cation/H+ antiporter subunit C n=1 Tax=Gleimia coleocanis DSM 15436 TaxID=525245 RepID=C0VYR9_9ACTO|nr:NADH-quinone oxidoreductase subunit K [Gleimia coleocanis]EEH64572.1 putative monovalent cation/H+ antiporter subunit C [Gleimia coleocanis DSM 15436]
MASVTLVALAGVLIACGAYLVTDRALTRIVIGLALLTHGVNLLILASGGAAGLPALLGHNRVAETGLPGVVDPLPQAMMLTAIVIGLGTTAFGMALAYRSWVQVGHDEVIDDVEDRLLAKRAEFAQSLAEASTGDEDPAVDYDAEDIETAEPAHILDELVGKTTDSSKFEGAIKDGEVK